MFAIAENRLKQRIKDLTFVEQSLLGTALTAICFVNQLPMDTAVDNYDRLKTFSYENALDMCRKICKELNVDEDKTLGALSILVDEKNRFTPAIVLVVNDEDKGIYPLNLNSYYRTGIFAAYDKHLDGIVLENLYNED